MWRVTAWGAVSGGVLAGAMIALFPTNQALPSVLDLLIYTAVIAGLGAGSAATSLGIAKRASIEAGEESAQLALP